MQNEKGGRALAALLFFRLAGTSPTVFAKAVATDAYLPAASSMLPRYGSMALRPSWKGHLKLSLVTCPVALYNAITPAGDVNFHLINPKTKHRVKSVVIDATNDEILDRKDLRGAPPRTRTPAISGDRKRSLVLACGREPTVDEMDIKRRRE